MTQFRFFVNVQLFFYFVQTPKFPIIGDIIDWYDKYGEYCEYVIGFLLMFIFFVYLPYWLFMKYPKQVKKVYGSLVKKGYFLIDLKLENTKPILEKLKAIYPTPPLLDEPVPNWNPFVVYKLEMGKSTRYVADVNRSQRDAFSSGHNKSTSDAMLVVEQRGLQFEQELHLSPKENGSRVQWEKRYQLLIVKDGIENDLLNLYDFYTNTGKIDKFPENLKKALIEISPNINNRNHWCIGNGITFRFQKEGWSLVTSNRVHKPEFMQLMTTVIDKISAAL
ncbi:hypothetical protein QUF75_17355 [Desulfococcaceae bacterium HSG7]|nr:hypothetical protein [Desulfococcaceae bacterium HSG7]